MNIVKVGIIGCGNISDIYFKNMAGFENLKVMACADLVKSLAEEKADLYSIPDAISVSELLSREDINLVLNLTPPKAHAEISIKALENGKHVYSEKPLAVSKEDGARIVELAKQKGLLAGSAPDTFLGAGIQTCLQLIQKGEIGRPVAASASMMGSGPEQWHPNPEFFYKEGAGPLFDMGPYYLTALVQLLGPIQHVSASASITFPERVIKTGEKKGQVIRVETPTHYTGVLEFEGGAAATMVMSFDVAVPNPPLLEIYGSEGTLKIPDPNHFGGPVLLKKKGEEAWRDVELTSPYSDNSRGIGVWDMVTAIQNQTSFRANSEIAFHVLETMHAFQESAESGQKQIIKSSCIPSPPFIRESIT
ncbi:Gfo/Idh/MocA family protein [Halobacillus massiliensis]|uniref:Gfo/Idh/MocA family protein n=1 Tax=Halobacillus massiliensis TaxID=1926286 RepID=UPI0009E1FA64|nr:Gfo/Idh/MocA family oxidoreductase [Halobacillus massiliensis]